jgi:hypothetical protein
MKILVSSWIEQGKLAAVAGCDEEGQPCIAGMNEDAFGKFKKKHGHLTMPFWAKIERNEIIPVTIN